MIGDKIGETKGKRLAKTKTYLINRRTGCAALGITSVLPVIRSVAEKSLLRGRRHLEGHRFGTQPSMG
jgi:hypothetical protein